MRKILFNLLRLFAGLFLYAVGIVCTINANLGLSPWDVFHQGLLKLTGITMGQASISTGLVIVILNWVLGEKVGLGTLFNMLFIGVFMDIIMLNHLIPVPNNFLVRLIMIIVGMMIIGIASYLYISAGLGAGPRDGLMSALTKKTKKSVRLVRNSIELVALLVGYFLGGMVGVGTLIMVFGGGYFVQLVFKLFKFDIKEIRHTFIDDYPRLIKEALAGSGKRL